jgi:hypothetical protein
MEFDKETILDMLRGQGETEKADRAQAELPDKVDTDRDAGLLQRLGIDPQELLGKLGGGLGGLTS